MVSAKVYVITPMFKAMFKGGNVMFPKEIERIISGLQYTKDKVGCSGDEVYLFENKFVLKVSTDSLRLQREKERNDWISQYIPGPKSICYLNENNKHYYFRTFLVGESLISPRLLGNPQELTDILVDVVKKLRSLDDKACPFASSDNFGTDFVHGDLCLPNIYINANNEFVGFIDLDNSGLGDKWYDYAWLLWSMEYNLKTARFNEVLLDKLGISFNKEKYEKYLPLENRKQLKSNE
jgi:aminoglycoside phosphotransferase